MDVNIVFSTLISVLTENTMNVMGDMFSDSLAYDNGDTTSVG